MDSHDTLASPDHRLSGLNDLVRGITIVNRLLGLAIPIPELKAWTPDILAGDAFADPDFYYGQLIGAIFDSRLEDLGWAGLMAQYDQILVRNERLDEVFARVAELARLSDDALVNEVSRSFTFEHLDFLSVFDKKGFVSVKINHAYWEELTFIGFDATAKLPPVRHFPRDAYYAQCRFDDVLIKALRKQQANAANQGFLAGRFSTPRFSLGVNFGNGDRPAFDCLSIPLNNIYKGAVIGSLSFLHGIFPARQYHLADGSTAKELVWRRQCDEFFARVVATADAVVFIVPNHLRAIEITHWEGMTLTIVIPSKYVHELWPSVMAHVAGKLADLFSKTSRVNILVQAGVMSVPLGILVDLMRDNFVDTQIRYFDMGQVLDVATYPANPVGPWIQHPKSRDILARTKRFPVSLRK